MHNVGKFSYIKYMKVCSQNKLARQTLINQKSTSYFLQKQVDKTTEKNLGENVTFIRLILSVKRGRGGHGESACLWTHAHHPPPQLTASEIKQTFLSPNLACLLAFEWRAAGPPRHTFW